jgi:hypothetical protein
VKLQSKNSKRATCTATCEVPEKYVDALIASEKWERIPENADTSPHASTDSPTTINIEGGA